MAYKITGVRAQRVEVFNDTEYWYTSDEALKTAVVHSIDNSIVYYQGNTPTVPAPRFDKTRVEVNRRRSFEAARLVHDDNPSARIGVLNFASATTPGGGVKIGSGAQEECLCRCSTLYPALCSQKDYYHKHRIKRNSLHTDDCIYTPEVLVIKTDTAEPERLEESAWLTVDVLTCAAPKLRNVSIEPERLLELHVQRGRHILSIAAHYGIDSMILGAFGCGAFMNDPTVVAGAYKKILPEFDGIFDRIVFAVFCSPKSDRNYVVFDEVING